MALDITNLKMVGKRVFLPQPNAQGQVEDYSFLIEDCHAEGLEVALVMTPYAASLIDPMGADKVVDADGNELTDFVTYRPMAEAVHGKATYLAEMLAAYEVEVLNSEFYDTVRYRLDDEEESIVVTPEWGLDEMNEVIEDIADRTDNFPCLEEDEKAFDGLWNLDESHVREL